MKQRFFMFLPALLLLLALSGCACSHDWLPADCMNPQSCSKCKEIGDSALGHAWLDATCTAPQTCSRCSAKQGETLAHTYSEWTFEEDQMTKYCLVCNDETTTEIDRELYLESLLNGYWDLWTMRHENDPAAIEAITFGSFLNGSMRADDITDTSHCGALYLSEGGDRSANFIFGEGKSCQIIMGLANERYNGIGVWELLEYAASGEEAFYLINVHMTQPRVEDVILVLCVEPDGMNKICFTGANSIMWFYQEQQDILDQICTNWAVDPQILVDQSYCFQFRPDRTATCYVEGVFEGTWCIGACPDDTHARGFSISYVRNGKNEVFVGNIDLSSSDTTAPNLYLQSRYNEFTGEYEYFHFLEVSDRELGIVQNATDLLKGTWTSFGYGMANPRLGDPLMTDYEITIDESNDVTLNLPDGKTYTGIWSGRTTSESFYSYDMAFYDGNEFLFSLHGGLSVVDGDVYLGLSSDGVLDSDTLYFKKMSESEHAGIKLPVGNWTSNNIVIVNHENSQTIVTDQYFMTFHEDGTFTAQLDQKTSGSWQYVSYYERNGIHHDSETGNTEPYTCDEWSYRLILDGKSEPVDILIENYRTENAQMRLVIKMKDSNNNEIRYYFYKD